MLSYSVFLVGNGHIVLWIDTATAERVTQAYQYVASKHGAGYSVVFVLRDIPYEKQKQIARSAT